MKFIIGEDFWTMLERATYRGAIGLYYDSTWSGVLAYIIFAAIIIFAVIGLITVLKTLFGIGGKQRCTRGYKRYKETSGLIEWKECQIFHSIFT